jgi:ABC-type polysaccharide/polyol phosphate export permease
MADAPPVRVPVLDVGPGPRTHRDWFGDLWDHREVLLALARKDFQTRYKRASFGVLWAVAVPLIQGSVMALVFSKVVKIGSGQHFAAYVISGILAWSYFSATLSASTTSVVDGSSLADKVWFPRAILPIVPALANCVGLAISYAVLMVLIPVLHVGYHPRLLLILPAMGLMVLLCIGFGLVLSALFVYFRDVRFLVQASLLVWLYVTPIVYQKSLLGDKAGWVDFNPMTGVVTLFHMAVIGNQPDWQRPVIVTLVFTVVMLAIGVEAHRRHDRLFVDKL